MQAVVFSKDNCGYCDKAKALLSKEGITYEEIKYPYQASKDDVKAVMPSYLHHRITFPQIVLDGLYLGGCDDLEDYLEEHDLILAA